MGKLSVSSHRQTYRLAGADIPQVRRPVGHCKRESLTIWADANTATIGPEFYEIRLA